MEVGAYAEMQKVDWPSGKSIFDEVRPILCTGLCATGRLSYRLLLFTIPSSQRLTSECHLLARPNKRTTSWL